MCTPWYHLNLFWKTQPQAYVVLCLETLDAFNLFSNLRNQNS